MSNLHNNISTVVAIDGPSGSGKSSMAKELANKLNLLFIDTGSMFRAIGFGAFESKINLEDDHEISNFLSSIKLEYGKSQDCLISLNGENLTEVIRRHEVSSMASAISQKQLVRNFLLDFQRGLAKDQICVMEGRDIGTVVFPNSFCKIFITASSQVRAQRRLNQLIEKGETQHSLENIIKDIEERDLMDQQRELAPLKQAHDAILLDTSDLTQEIVLERLCSIVADKSREHSVIL